MRDTEIKKQIDAYVKGQLTEKEIEALWVELAKNPDLLDVLEVEVGVKKLFEEESISSKKKATVHKLPRWTWHAAAAAVIVVVALVQLFNISTPTEMNQFVVGNIEAEQLETADGLRNELDISPADSLLNLGFKAFISGDEDRALTLFDQVILEFDQEPYGSKAYLNKGIVLYNEGAYEQAAEAFRESANRAVDSRMISEKANWYLGNALVNLGELEEAQQAIYTAYQLEGIFRKPAFRLLVKLNQELGYSDTEKDLEPKAMD